MAKLTCVGGVRPHVQSLGNVDRCAQLLSPHRRLIKSFQVDDQDLREPENGHVLLHIVYSFAFGAFIAAVLHLLRCSIAANALIYINVASVPDSFAWNGNGQVHEVVEGE